MNPEGSGDWTTPRVSRVRPFPNRLLGSYPTPYTPITEGPLIEEEENATPYTPVSEGGLCSSSSEVENKTVGVPKVGLTEERQIQMELQMSKLQDQVQGLSSILQNRLPTANSSEMEQENQQLREACQVAEHNLQETEDRLTNLQESVLCLQDEYQRESEELQAQVKELTVALERVEDEKIQLKRCAEKADKTKKALEAYLSTLPSKEEFDEMRNRLRLKSDENERLCQKAGILTARLDRTRKTDEILKEENLVLQRKIEDLKAISRTLENTVSGHERRKSEASNMDETLYEKVLHEKEILEDENVKLKKYISITQRRAKKDLELRAKKIESTEKELTVARVESESVSENYALEKSTNRFLREDLTKSKVLVTSLQKQLEALSNELGDSRNSESSWQELDTCNRRLGNEIAGCLNELQCLSSVTKTIIEGKDPNISTLLGIRSLDLGTQIDLKPSHSQTFEKRRTLIQKQTSEIQAVRADIVGIQASISEKYAENLGSDMSSCTTQ